MDENKSNDELKKNETSVKEEKKEHEHKKEDDKKDKKVSFSDYKAEFKKIVWPSRKDLVKQTATVIVVSIIVGVIIFGMDSAFNVGFSQIVKLLA